MSLPYTKMNIEFGVKIRGRVSFFGGPSDELVTPSEGLALYERVEQMPQIFLSEQPDLLKTDPGYPGKTTGLARRLDPDKMYIAMRWQYATTPKEVLRRSIVRVYNPKNDKHCYAIPSDFGPAEWTNRVADVSPGVMKMLELVTDDIVECTLIPIKEFKEGA